MFRPVDGLSSACLFLRGRRRLGKRTHWAHVGAFILGASCLHHVSQVVVIPAVGAFTQLKVSSLAAGGLRSSVGRQNSPNFPSQPPPDFGADPDVLAATQTSPLPWGEESSWNTLVHQVFTTAMAVVVGFSLSVGVAFADDSSGAATVEAALSFIKRNYYDQTFNKQDFDGLRAKYLERARKGESAESLTRELVASLGDRYSRIVDAATFEKLMAFDPLGVGVVLTRNERKEIFVSSEPFNSSSAAKAGLRQGDIVERIDGLSLETESLFSVMDRVAQADRPEVLLAMRRGPAEVSAERWEQTLARSRTSMPQDRVETGVAPIGPDGHRVGFLRLRSFGAKSARDMAQALKEVRAQGADEFALDLRGNGGGSFQVALEIATLFLEPDSVATRVKTTSAETDQLVRVTPSAPDGSSLSCAAAAATVAREPLVVLVDQGSASASEVLAAALRGNCRAPLLGARTYGKAAVQGVFGLPNREAMAITVARYSAPTGTRIEGGLRPDGPGPGDNPFSQAASALGLPVDFTAADYAKIDFSAARQTELLKTCRPSESW